MLFLITLREAVQCALIIAIVLSYPGIKDNRAFLISLSVGVILSVLSGFPYGYISYGNQTPEIWTFLRHLSEALILYLGMAFVVIRPATFSFIVCLGLILLGFSVFFFEARAIGFLMHDIGKTNSNTVQSALSGIAGTLTGFIGSLYVFKLTLKKLHPEKAMTLPGLLILVGALKFLFGGVAEIEETQILVSLQNGLMVFLEGALRYMQSMLLITEHPFIDIPFSGIIRFLSGDSTAMALVVIFITTPPVFMLIRLFAEAEPVMSDIQKSAERRLKITFFRKELFYQAVPALSAFIILIISLHTANIILNPLYEPPPFTLRADEDVLKIPITDKSGDLTDGKLRKYAYYSKDKEIVFIAILKPDGSMGVALDECEVCRPADWMKSAKGYAQRGNNLICKYCMTPIAIATVNEPGGCNPIPLPFRLTENHIIISMEDLINIHKYVEALEGGTHW